MIVGLGVDVVDVSRFAETLTRTPAIRTRVFSPAEQEKPLASLAARFAAKEALAKALGAPGLQWVDCEIISEPSGEPRFEMRGTVLARATAMGVVHVHVSLSHDAGLASAVVVLES